MHVVRKCVALLLTFALLISSASAITICSEWFVPDYQSIQEYDLIPESLQNTDLAEPMTREEMCDAVVTLWIARGEPIPMIAASPFYDTDSVSVLICYGLGLVEGYGENSFGPNDLLTRQQMFCIITRLLKTFMPIESGEPDNIYAFIDGSDVAPWAMESTTTLLHYDIVRGSDGYLLPAQNISREQALAMLCRIWKMLPDGAGDSTMMLSDVVLPTEEFLFDDTDEDQDYLFETMDEKYIRIFGSLDQPKYQSAAEAEAHMVTIAVPVWNFNYEHVKVQTSRTFVVHEAIADMVMAIFTEIYYGEEQFPIYSVGGYSWRGDGTSEHNWGIAIDINPDENYYVYHGVPTTGSYWKPGEDPYSILPDGDVVRAFAKYGFAWGGNAWSSSQDYMHFSYFGG